MGELLNMALCPERRVPLLEKAILMKQAQTVRVERIMDIILPRHHMS
jgi:hypothetical protein